MQIGNVSALYIGENESLSERYERRLKTLISSTMGMFPMHRKVGIDPGVMDLPAGSAAAALSTSIYTVAGELLPEVDLQEVTCMCDEDKINVHIAYDLLLDSDDDMDAEVEDDEDYERV